VSRVGLHPSLARRFALAGYSRRAMLSANEEHGNYIVTAFMGFTVPTGSNVDGNGHSLFTPTLAAGKALATSTCRRRLE
jgi:hypothetical protein